jgi:hypothetical protein
MSKTETKSRAGEVFSPAQDVRQDMTGFVSNFRGFQADMQAKI